MKSQSSEPRKRSSSNLVFLVALGVVVTALIGWSAYWYAASRRTQTALAAWTQREAQAGRNWVCPEPRIGGYPFTVEITCGNAAFQGTLAGKKVTGTLREFRAAASILQPDYVSAELEPPFMAKASDGTIDLTAHWEHLFFDFEGTPDALNRAALIGEKVVLKGTIAGFDAANGTIGRFNTYIVRLPDRPDNAFEFLLALHDSSIPALNQHLNLTLPSALALGGTITQADFGAEADLQDKIEHWRNAHGIINLKTARLTSGNQKFEARGDLDLDDEHRVRGELDAEFANFNAALQQLGFDPMLVAAGTFLTDVLGNKTRSQGEVLGAGRLRLPLSIADGWLSIGPVRTSVRLPPLY